MEGTELREDTLPRTREVVERLERVGYLRPAAEHIAGARVAPLPSPSRVSWWPSLPVQGVVDRGQPLVEPATVDTPIMVGGTVVIVLREPRASAVGGSFGRLPGDPARFSDRVNPRTGVCRALTGSAVGRCLRPGGYF